MNQKKIQIIIFGSLLTLCSHSAMACKMTAMGGSAQTITAVVNHVAEDPQQQDRTIKRITQENSSNWTYIVETIQGENDCRAVSYQAVIDPSCQIKVESVAGNFSCNTHS
ncbi:MAG TPA: hypothetical protein VHE99_00095 [Gammaproteobacteria bacterium]|nr:hypothetical protein [Gammaproteobacteria bacterium]